MMKKIFFIAFLFLSFESFAQTKITAGLFRNSPPDTYAVTYDSLQRGGMHVYSTIAERNAIPAGLRKRGMLAAVDTTIYRLKTGITNSDWAIFSGSPPQGLQSVTNIDSATTNKISARTYNATGIPTFENLTQAIAANLKNGDFYYVHYNNGNYLLAIVVGAILTNALLAENGTAILTENGTPILTN